MIELWGSLEYPGEEADLERIASLGIRTLVQPVAWERVAPCGLHCPAWQSPDERLERMRALARCIDAWRGRGRAERAA